MNKYFKLTELKQIGFKKVGKNCKISKSISTHNLIGSLGDNIRIDDDVQLKGKIELKSNSHIARGCTLSGGKEGIFIDEFTSLANYVQIYSSSDDYYSASIPVATLDKKMRKNFQRSMKKNINWKMLFSWIIICSFTWNKFRKFREHRCLDYCK